jgi:two-component system, sensor histidine kinase PdtaS
LSVSDDGVGRRHDGTESTHVGLGTSIVEALARQLKSRVEIFDGHPGTATSIIDAAA